MSHLQTKTGITELQPTAQSPTCERLPGETNKAFQAATIYIQMGTSRSIAAVARQLSKNDALISRWSQRWRWVERAAGWDNQLACEQQMEERRAALEREAQRLRRRQENEEWLDRSIDKLKAKFDKLAELPIATMTLKNGTTIVKSDHRVATAMAKLALDIKQLLREDKQTTDEDSERADERFIFEDYQ